MYMHTATARHVDCGTYGRERDEPFCKLAAAACVRACHAMPPDVHDRSACMMHTPAERVPSAVQVDGCGHACLHAPAGTDQWPRAHACR